MNILITSTTDAVNAEVTVERFEVPVTVVADTDGVAAFEIPVKIKGGDASWVQITDGAGNATKVTNVDPVVKLTAPGDYRFEKPITSDVVGLAVTTLEGQDRPHYYT